MSNRKLNLQWNGYFNYNKENVDKHAPYNKAGVYKIGFKRSNGKWLVKYVGQANDLDRRLKEHLDLPNEKNACLSENLKKFISGFCFAEVALQEDRDGVEKALFEYYNPECNDPDVIPSGPNIDINTN